MPRVPDISGKSSQSLQLPLAKAWVCYPCPMSLRFRVVGLIAAVLFVSILLGTLVAGVQAKHVLRAELNAALDGARQTVVSAYEDLPNSDHQARDLRQLVATFDGNRHVLASLRDAKDRVVQASKSGKPLAQAPLWFQHFLGSAPSKIELRVPKQVSGFSAIVLIPTAAIDVADAWDQFLGVAIVLIGSAAFGLVLVYLVIGAAFRPLRGLSAEFERIGAGDYSGRVGEQGPPELLRLQHGFNKMAGQLAGTTARNRDLTNQLLTIQDEERADIARDLHDEIGPHLFAVNMDAEMIMQLHGSNRSDAIPDQVRSIQTAVNHIQRQVKDLLGRLRPTPATEFGLNAAILDLVRFWGARRPDIAFELKLKSDEDWISDATREAAYRIVQEAANNAVRHGNPQTIEVCVELENGSELLVMITDDGAETSGRQKAGGLGLVGMRERVSALGGSLSAGRFGGEGWSVSARLPIARLALREPVELGS